MAKVHAQMSKTETELSNSKKERKQDTDTYDVIRVESYPSKYGRKGMFRIETRQYGKKTRMFTSFHPYKREV